MKLMNSIIILAHIICECRSHRRSVDYAIDGGISLNESHVRVSCAETCADNMYLAARINDVTGMCKGLTWDWGSDPQYEAGFTYIRKTRTVEIYEPVLSLQTSYNWLIPGFLGVGAWIEFYITIPTGNWNGFTINVLDSTAFSYNVYDGQPEVIMAHLLAYRSSGGTAIKTWMYGWTYITTVSPFLDGGTYKIQIVPQETILKIFFDDVEVVQYSHVTDPRTAKQLEFSIDTNTVLELHNITFVGI